MEAQNFQRENDRFIAKRRVSACTGITMGVRRQAERRNHRAVWCRDRFLLAVAMARVPYPGGRDPLRQRSHHLDDRRAVPFRPSSVRGIACGLA